MGKNSKSEMVSTTLALTVSIVTALCLAVLKCVVGFLTQSMAVTASALDSLMDTCVSSVNLIAAREAAKPPDEEHAYGHGKIESIAALFQSQVILAMGLYLIIQAIRRLVMGGEIHAIPVGFLVMTISLAATIGLILFLRYVQRRNHSLLLSTEKVHFSMDVMTHLGVMLALVLVRVTGLVIWDLLISIFIALYIFKAAFDILKRSIDELLDRSLGAGLKEEIESIIRNHHPAIVGIHDFRSHQVGGRIFLDFHIELRGVKDFIRAHRITESLICEINEKYEGSDVTVHYDPEGET